MNQSARPIVSRNQPCVCNSGKKYKHCCALNAGDSGGAAAADYRELLDRARAYAYQQGNFAAAEQSYRQVLEIKPNNAEALAGVGQGLCWRHRRAEGRQYLSKAAGILLRNTHKLEGRLLLDLSEQLQLWGEPDLALQLARAAARLMPNNPAAHYGIAACLHRLNRVEPALLAMHRLLQLAPDDAGARILMALLEQDKGLERQAQQRLEQVVATEQDPPQLARACLELSKVYDRQKRYAEAFALLTRAGDLHRRLLVNRPVDANFLFDKVRLYRQGYDAALLKRWSASDFADDLPVPVFLFGFLRSGTTLTEQVLSAHPAVLTSDENHLIDEVIGELERLTGIQGNTPEALRGLDLDQARQLRRFYWRRAADEFTAAVLKKCFVNKVALNSIETGFIATLFPEAKIIFAVRDPRDVCLSCAMQSFGVSIATVNLLSWQGIARQYAAVMDLWLSLRGRIAPAYLELRYEDSVGDFEASFRRVFDLLEVDWHPEVLRFHRHAAGRFVSTPSFSAVARPLYRSAVARWQGYAEHFEPIRPLLQPYIDAFGYD